MRQKRPLILRRTRIAIQIWPQVRATKLGGPVSRNSVDGLAGMGSRPGSGQVRARGPKTTGLGRGAATCDDEVSGTQSLGEGNSVAVRGDAAKIGTEIAALRHASRREPDSGLDLPKTQGKVLGALDGLPLEISTGRGLSSVTAVLRGGKPGPAVLLRGDMDALPITEATGLPFASRHDGVMHACGHDLHVAMLAGAAKLLSARKAELPGSVVFMFQPGEEGYAGARSMIGEGVLDAAGRRVVGAYGLHVTSNK